MTTTADAAAERAFEAALAGRPVPPGASGLAAFTEAVRATATQPGHPNPALAELLATGLTVDRPDTSARVAERRRPPMWSALHRIASAGAVARVAAGAGIVVVGVTGAGTAGVLPAGAQRAFAQVVEAATSLQAPDPQRTAETGTATSEITLRTTASATGTPGTPTTESRNEATPTPAGPVPTGYDCDPGKPFGDCVNQHRQVEGGPLTPAQVNEWARYYQAHRADHQATTDLGRAQDPTHTKSNSSATPSSEGSAGQQAGHGEADASRGAAHGQGHR